MQDGPIKITRDIWCANQGKSIELKVVQGEIDPKETAEEATKRYFQDEAQLKADCK